MRRSFQVQNSRRLAPPERCGAGVADAGSPGRVVRVASRPLSAEAVRAVACVTASASRRSSRRLEVSACWRINSVRLTRAEANSSIMPAKNRREAAGARTSNARVSKRAPRTTRPQEPLGEYGVRGAPGSATNSQAGGPLRSCRPAVPRRYGSNCETLTVNHFSAQYRYVHRPTAPCSNVC